jgi:hypothetical protein
MEFAGTGERQLLRQLRVRLLGVRAEGALVKIAAAHPHSVTIVK